MKIYIEEDNEKYAGQLDQKDEDEDMLLKFSLLGIGNYGEE
jgi:hypothetical protein